LDYLVREILNHHNPKKNPFVGTVDQVGNDIQRIIGIVALTTFPQMEER
jgi:hypothetical protein